MQNNKYRKELEKLKAKFDKNSYLINEILESHQHNMFVEGEDCQDPFQQTFDAVKEDYFALEKVDLIDYWNLENGRNYKTR